MTDERWAEWKEILKLSVDGKIDIYQLKLELMDFDDMIDRMSFITDLISNSNLSKSTYTKDVLKDQYNDRMEENYQMGVEDGKLIGNDD